jgi:Oxidoreductase family, C-terminal alpha/beta domain
VGGPLYDIGVYCINAARYLFRSEPQEVFAYNASGNDGRFDEVEEMSAAVMRFPDDRLATFTCSFGAADRSAYEVIGTKGVLKMDPAYEMVSDLKREIIIDGRVQTAKFPKCDQFGPELVYFSNCILQNKEPEPGGREGLIDVRIINALLESARSGKPVQVRPLRVGERPSQQQEIHKPPFGKPELVPGCHLCRHDISRQHQDADSSARNASLHGDLQQARHLLFDPYQLDKNSCIPEKGAPDVSPERNPYRFHSKESAPQSRVPAQASCAHRTGR